MKKRLFSLFIVILFTLSLVPAVQAQGDLTCFTLSEADCAILTTAMANTEALTSFNTDFNGSMTLGGLAALGAMLGDAGGTPMGDILVTFTGSGPIAEDMAAMPPMAMQMDLTGEMDDGTGSGAESGTMSLIVKDGVVYLSTDTDPWEGIAITDLIAADPTFASLFGEMGDMPDAALSPGDLAGDPAAMLEAAGLGEDAMALMNIPGFITSERLADEEMMGQMMAVFRLSMDFTPLFNSPEFQAVLSEGISAAAAEDPDAAQMAMMAPMLLSGLTLTYDQTTYVGVGDQLVHGMTLNLNGAMDLAILMGGAGAGSDMELPPITLDVMFELGLDQANEAFDIQAPADATMVDPAEMEAIFGAF